MEREQATPKPKQGKPAKRTPQHEAVIADLIDEDGATEVVEYTEPTTNITAADLYLLEKPYLVLVEQRGFELNRQPIEFTELGEFELFEEVVEDLEALMENGYQGEARVVNRLTNEKWRVLCGISLHEPK